MRNMCAALLFVLLTVSASFAAVPQTINYQGYLKDSVSGAPITTQVTVSFRLYDSLQASSPLWAEQLNVTPQNGIFSVLLGSEIPLGSYIFENPGLYLGIQVGSDPELTPRQQIHSVPFAMRAATADSVNPATIVIDAAQIESGTLDSARLPANTAKLDNAQTFSANQTFQDQTLKLSNSANSFSTTLHAGSATAARTLTLPDASGTVITTGNLAGITGTGTVTSGSWNSSIGSNMVTSSSIQDGAVTPAKLSGTLPVVNGGTGLAAPGSSGQVLTSTGTSLTWATPSSSGGTVTSVAVSGGSTGLSTSGGPITGSGTITLGGVLGINSGGTGATNSTTAINFLLPSQSGNSGKLLGTNGATASWVSTAPGFGTNTNTAASGMGAECTMGEIILSAGSVANGMPASGQTLQIAQYSALFALIGNMYGGDGVSNFRLPDLRNVAPNGLTYSICIFGTFPIRD